MGGRGCVQPEAADDLALTRFDWRSVSKGSAEPDLSETVCRGWHITRRSVLMPPVTDGIVLVEDHVMESTEWTFRLLYTPDVSER